MPLFSKVARIGFTCMVLGGCFGAISGYAHVGYFGFGGDRDFGLAMVMGHVLTVPMGCAVGFFCAIPVNLFLESRVTSGAWIKIFFRTLPFVIGTTLLVDMFDGTGRGASDSPNLYLLLPTTGVIFVLICGMVSRQLPIERAPGLCQQCG